MASRRAFTGGLPVVNTAGGLLVLSIPPIVLFGLGAVAAVREPGTVVIGGALLAATLAIAGAVRNEWALLRPMSELAVDDPRDATLDASAVFAGTLLALGGVVELGLSPIVAAALVGIISVVVAPDRAVPAYCGAFVGMTSPTLFPAYWYAVLAAGVAALVYVVAYPSFHGVGGKLGTTAFVGTTLTVLVTGGTFHSGQLPDAGVSIRVVAYSIVGAMVTYAIQAELGRSAVLASGLVGAAGGTTIPIVLPDGADVIAAGVFAASFAGMSDPRRISTVAWIGLTGLLVGLTVVFSAPYIGGSGGKLGTIAFGSSLAVHAVLQRLHRVRLRRRFDHYPRRDTT